MHPLITLHQSAINRQMVQTVNARELHSFLQSKQDFSTWIKNRIERYGFVENQDFIIAREVIAPQKNGAEKSMTYANWQGKIDYHITLDMAKQLAMVENNDMGLQARRYFIECEKQLKQAHTGIDVKKSQMELLNILTANPILSDVAKQTLLITTAEKIMGVSLDYRPQVAQTTYSAKEIGNGWINPKDHLPDRDMIVTYHADGSIRVTDLLGSEYEHKIVYWQPLPQTPKE